MFGGFQDNTKRFNDVWVFDTHTLKWSQPIKLRSESEIAPNASLSNKLNPTPQPRGEHAAAQINGQVYIFGGYGKFVHTCDCRLLKLFANSTYPWFCWLALSF